MPNGRFEKGHHIGRPKGAKTRNWLNIDYWYNHLMAEFPLLKPAQRAKISLEVLKVLVNKSPSLPVDPSESVKNTEAAFNLIRALENGDKPNSPDTLSNVKTEGGDTGIAIPPTEPRI